MVAWRIWQRCNQGETISFRVDGERTEQSRMNNLEPYFRDVLDVTLP